MLAEVQKGIAAELPKTFGICFDGWTCNREHYIAIFASYMKNNSAVTTLLSCGVQDLPDTVEVGNEFGFAAEDIGDYVRDVLNRYNRDWDCIEFISGDNCSTNHRLATLLTNWLQHEGINRNVPLVGCVCHKLNLAIKNMLAIPANADVVNKVHALMSEVMSIKNSVKLAAVTKLNPEIENDTRWNSTFRILDKYLKLVEPMKAAALPINVKAMFLKRKG